MPQQAAPSCGAAARARLLHLPPAGAAPERRHEAQQQAARNDDRDGDGAGHLRGPLFTGLPSWPQLFRHWVVQWAA